MKKIKKPPLKNLFISQYMMNIANLVQNKPPKKHPQPKTIFRAIFLNTRENQSKENFYAVDPYSASAEL